MKKFINRTRTSAPAPLQAPILALILAPILGSALTACGVSDADAPEASAGKPTQARLIGEKSGVTQMTMIVTVTLDPNDKDTVSKTAITQYFVWDNWGKKTAKYQLDRTSNIATKTLMRVKQSGDKLSMDKPSGLVDLVRDEFNPTVPPVYNGLLSFTPDNWHKDIYTDLLVNAGFERTGQIETVKDRDCEIIQVSVRRYCMWKGIALADQSNNGVTQTFGLTEGIYSGEVDPRHFERDALAWPSEVIADLESYAYEKSFDARNMKARQG